LKALSMSVASVLALGFATQAVAQDLGQIPQDAGATPGSDIIVTARKREEVSQDVPVAITAFTGEQ
jgi:iron complex outermembrane receptor protein